MLFDRSSIILPTSVLLLTLFSSISFSAPTASPDDTIVIHPIAKGPSNLTMTQYSYPGCGGVAFMNRNVNYDNDVPVDKIGDGTAFKSYWINRPLRPNERLDFSTVGESTSMLMGGTPMLCGTYLESAVVQADEGCYNIGNPNGAECYRLWAEY